MLDQLAADDFFTVNFKIGRSCIPRWSSKRLRVDRRLPHFLNGSTSFTAFDRAFQECGLPRAIRTDNGVPFASPTALYRLSKLAVWWLRLGIQLERIQPGHPQQNGRHERMHRTLKAEATKPAAANVLQQQSYAPWRTDS